MSTTVESEVFGNKTKTGVLLSIYLLEETFLREISRVLEVRPYSVQLAVEAFEDEGIIRTVKLGSERRVALNPTYYAADELKQLLAKLANINPALMSRVAGIRRRPRKRGKAVDPV